MPERLNAPLDAPLTAIGIRPHHHVPLEPANLAIPSQTESGNYLTCFLEEGKRSIGKHVFDAAIPPAEAINISRNSLCLT